MSDIGRIQPGARDLAETGRLAAEQLRAAEGALRDIVTIEQDQRANLERLAQCRRLISILVDDARRTLAAAQRAIATVSEAGP